jgi:hypothetical protein
MFNPVAGGAIFCAEKLQCVAHLMFTMPWTPTKVGPGGPARPACRGSLCGGRQLHGGARQLA